MRRVYPMAVALLAVPALGQTVPAAAPVEHRLSAAEIEAAQADGETRNRAAEQLALSRGDPTLALPAERPKKVHGSAEVAIGTNGYREFGGELSTTFGDHAQATVAGDYFRYDAPFRQRPRNR